MGGRIVQIGSKNCDRRNANSPKALHEWSKRRGMIGIDPIADVDKVNIPVMMVHGDLERRVEYYHFKDFQAAMKRAGKVNPWVTVGDLADTAAAGAAADQSTDGEVIATRQQAGYKPRSRFVTLKGADHFYNTLMYNHQEKLYTEILDFVRNDCGPGGL